MPLVHQSWQSSTCLVYNFIASSFQYKLKSEAFLKLNLIFYGWLLLRSAIHPVCPSWFGLVCFLPSPWQTRWKLIYRFQNRSIDENFERREEEERISEKERRTSELERVIQMMRERKKIAAGGLANSVRLETNRYRLPKNETINLLFYFFCLFWTL